VTPVDGPGRSRSWAVRRVVRDTALRLRHPRNHIAYYRAVMQGHRHEGRRAGRRQQ
jgi:hypothetical protein